MIEIQEIQSVVATHFLAMKHSLLIDSQRIYMQGPCKSAHQKRIYKLNSRHG